MALDASFFKEEIRSGFLVTEKRKKVWAIELEILKKFDQVCKNYNLTYFAYYGTLLGAVRHQGFIPWDDDIDVIMFRDDYEKFQSVASKEFTEPYFFQNSYTDQIVWPFSKIRDSRTTAIERQFCDIHQGIFIDIFPFDSALDEINKQFLYVREIQKFLWRMITDPKTVLLDIKERLNQGQLSTQDLNFIMNYMKKDIKEKFRIFEDVNLEYFGKTEDVNFIMDEICPSNYKSVKKEWFRNIEYVSFENIQIPIPAEYDKILTRCYGNYHKFIMGGSAHENIILDPEIPYNEYLLKYL